LMNRSDAVGNDWGGSDSELVFGVHHQYGSQGHIIDHPNAIFETVGIKVYDIYENLVADYDYRFEEAVQPITCHSFGVTYIRCQYRRPRMRLVSQNYPDPNLFPGHVVDLVPYYPFAGTPLTNLCQRQQTYDPTNTSTLQHNPGPYQ
jgi:hypothetical protein